MAVQQEYLGSIPSEDESFIFMSCSGWHWGSLSSCPVGTEGFLPGGEAAEV